MTGDLARLVLLIPILTIVALLFLKGRAEIAKALSLVSGIASLVVVTFLGFQIEPACITVAHRSWIPAFGVQFHLGLDPVGFAMLWITAFSTLLGVAASIREMNPKSQGATRVVFHFILLFVIQGALYGVFMARDLVLFFIAYEIVLIPMYLLILLWGGKKRVYASFKFLLFTMFGSLPMLMAIAYIGYFTAYKTGMPVFDMDQVRAMGLESWTAEILLKFPFFEHVAVKVSSMLFAGFALAFLVKIPLWPLHTWLPDAHTEAPTAGSIVLAGVLLKMGAYGLAAVAIPLFPATAMKARPILEVFALCGIILGALASLAQTDAKRLVAYSSVSHMGFVVLGLFSFTTEGWLGAVMQMMAHGVSTGALFYFVGALYRRRHDRELASFGGLSTLAPAMAGWSAIAVFSSTALPGTAGFAAELMILFGVFSGKPVLAALAGTAVILSAAYMLKFFKQIAFGEPTREFRDSWDGMKTDEILALAACGLILIVVGVAPWHTVYRWLDPGVAILLQALR